MADEKEPIGVIGVGWVGLVTAACFAELGHEVWARDIVPAKVESLSRGEVPIHEPGLPELVAQNAERLHFTTDMAEVLEHTRLLFVCVDTPPTYSGDADLSRVESVLDELGDSGEHALVMKSTVPVGTGRSIQRRRPGHRATSPTPSSSRRATRSRTSCGPTAWWWAPTRARSEYAERVLALYAPLDAPMVSTDVASAEMIKLASNAFLATKISFINEIANVSEELGADVQEVAYGMGLDNRIGPKFLQAGIGYGGSCFPKDVQALKQLAGNTGYHFQLLTSVIEVNELQKRRTIGKLQKHLGSLEGKEVALLGVAFKPDTDDIREATSLVLSGPAPGRGRQRARLRPGRRPQRQLDARRRAHLRLGARGDRRRGRRGARDRVARVRRARLDRRGQGAHARAAGRRRAQLPRPRAARSRPGFTYEGIGR